MTLSGNLSLLKAKENNRQNRSSGATSIKHMATLPTGASTTHTAPGDLPNGNQKALADQNGNSRNGVTITNLTVTPLQHVAKAVERINNNRNPA